MSVMYARSGIDVVAAALRGRRKPVDVDIIALEARLIEIFEKYGVIDSPDEFTRLFQELGDEEEPPNSERFRRIRDLSIELSLQIDQPSIKGVLNSRARSALSSRQKRKEHSELVGAAAAFRFVEKARAALQIIAELADKQRSYEATQVRDGRPVDAVIDDLLLDLADLFIEIRACDDVGRWDVPHSVGSVFIRFASAALGRFSTQRKSLQRLYPIAGAESNAVGVAK